MIRFTHRRCRHEIEGLADAAARQTENAEDLALANEGLADDLRAAEHAMDEVVDACKDAEYALTEASIPAVLRERLTEADRLPIVETDLVEARAKIETLKEQRARMLEDAHDQGRLIQVLALTPTKAPLPHTIQEALDGLSTLTWQEAPWWCPAECGSDTRTLAWHQWVPDRAHLSCECRRVWPAPAGAVAWVQQELATRELFGGVRAIPVRWADRPQHELEAIDRALPTPAQIRDREVVPA